MVNRSDTLEKILVVHGRKGASPATILIVLALVGAVAGAYFLTRPGPGGGVTPLGQTPVGAGQPPGSGGAPHSTSGQVFEFYTPVYEPWGGVSDTCMNPLQVVEIDTFLNELKEIDGASIVKEEDSDWQSDKPSVTLEDYDSFGGHVAYVISKEASDMSWTRYELYYDGTKIYDSEAKVSVELFGDNILHFIEQDSYDETQAVFNNGIDALAGQMMTYDDSCTMSTDSVFCMKDDSSEIYQLGTYLGNANENFQLVRYPDSDIRISKYNFQWVDDDGHVQLMLLGGSKSPPPNLGMNNKALQVIQLDATDVTDLGQTSYEFSPRLFGNHVAYLECDHPEDSYFNQNRQTGFWGANTCHVIYDGKDLGPGEDPWLFGDHIAFTSTYTYCNGPQLECSKPVVVYDNKIIDAAKELALDPKLGLSISNVRIFGSHIAYNFNYGGYGEGNEQHVAYDGEDLGPGHDFILFGDHIMFYRDATSDDSPYAYNVVYDGEDLGPGGYVVLFGDHIAFLNGDSNVYSDGKSYTEGDVNILANLAKCRQYYLENEVETSPFGQNPNFELKRFDA